MRVYGYVNRRKGKDEAFLENENTDEIILYDGKGFDFSFADKGDLVILQDFKSVCDNLKEMLEFTQFIYETGIDFMLVDEKTIDTRKSMGKLMIGIWSGLNKYDDAYFQFENQLT